MRLFILIVALLASSVAFSQETPYVVFNEFNMDNPGGADAAEFVELYGTPLASLDSLVIVLYEGTGDTVYNAFDLDGYALDENGFFVLGNAAAINVDYIIPNATIQNGADGIVLYQGDAADFPIGSAVVTANMIDAAVYGTNDPTDAGLIAALGLDVLIPGYTQLDETAQQNGPDNSLSRMPDGGVEFDYSLYVFQQITPGTYNYPQCAGSSVNLIDLTTNASYCDNSASSIVEWNTDGTGYGDSLLFVLSDSNGDILSTTSDSSYDFTGMAVGVYTINAFYYNGTLDSNTLATGQPVNGILASSCGSLSVDAISIDIIQCGGCQGGEISNAGNTPLSFCTGTGGVESFSTNSVSVDDQYHFVLADGANAIIDTFSTQYDLNLLTAGNYTVWGISYLGDLDPITIQAGSDASLIASSICVAYSSNQLTVQVFDCVAFDPCTYVFISEYLEGNNGTKALELFNPTLSNLDLTGYSVYLYSNGSLTPTATLDLSGSLGALGTYLIANPGAQQGNNQADPAVLALADIQDVVANFSGNDAIELRYNDQIIDVIGVVGEDPGTQVGWPVGNSNTRNVDMVRMFNVQSPINIWDISSTQWDIYANTDYSHLGNHIFNTCSNETLAGFVTDNLIINENAGTITISVQGINIQDSTSIFVNLTGGTADNADYTAAFPVELIFDGTSNVLTFTIDIINDALAEGAETILLSLETSENISWTNQNMSITILQSDPNCAGGFLPGGPGNQAIDQCSDIANTLITITPNTNFPDANYVFVITNANDSIIEIVSGPDIDMDNQGAGTFHIWGLSYTGALDPESTVANLPVDGIIADSCASVSNNFITVIRTPCIITGCDGADVTMEDGNTVITICTENVATVIIPLNTSQSVDASYTYFITSDTDNIIGEIDGSWSSEGTAAGTYHIWGISYIGTLDGTTTQEGSLITGITSSDCVQTSAGFIEVVITDCGGPAPCSQLYFSEILEDSQSNKALEIYNPTPFTVNLADYTVNMYSNGDPNPTNVLACAGLLGSHDVYVVISSGNGQTPSDQALIDAADTLHAVSTFSGNDALELLYLGTPIDMVGIIGDDPGQIGWTFGNSSTANHDLVRRPEVSSPNADWTIVSGQWISYGPTDYTHLGTHDAIDCGNPDLPQVTFTTLSQTVTENTASITIEVQTNNVVTPFDLLVTADGTATLGSDYGAGLPLTLNIPTGSSILSFTINIYGDGIIEGDETIELHLSTTETVYYVLQNSTVIIQDYLGVDEQTTAQLAVYPNPGSNIFNLQSEHKIHNVQLFDNVGRSVYSKSGMNTNRYTLDISSFAEGQYILKAQTEDGVFHIPVMIQR